MRRELFAALGLVYGAGVAAGFMTYSLAHAEPALLAAPGGVEPMVGPVTAGLVTAGVWWLVMTALIWALACRRGRPC